MAKYVFFVTLIVGFIVENEMHGLYCWRCTSDSDIDPNGGEFCADPFDVMNLTKKQKHNSYVKCRLPRGYEEFDRRAEPFCQKFTEEDHDKIIITRSCSYGTVPKDLPESGEYNCSLSNYPFKKKPTKCFMCFEDECNRAPEFSSVTYLALIFIVVLNFV